MNKFNDLIKDLEARAREQSQDDVLITLDQLLPKDDEPVQGERFRLPYSSDPRSVEHPWK